VSSLLLISLFVASTFAASLVAGTVGFALGLVAAAVWLHILMPLQTATLIVVVFGRAARRQHCPRLKKSPHFKRLF
jgi:hypothetical protein